MENLSLIDWRMVGFASLWILGLALVLCALGFAYSEAGQAGEIFRARMRRPVYQRTINTGLMLFCLGMIGSATAWWEGILWGLLAVAFAFYTWQTGKSH